jgi:hypothetical protein
MRRTAALENNTVKAIEKNGMFVCGECGHKIAGYRDGKLYLLCKHKGREGKCNTISELDLQALQDDVKNVVEYK